MSLYTKYCIYRQLCTTNFSDAIEVKELIWKDFILSFKRTFLSNFKIIDVSKFLRNDLMIISIDEVKTGIKLRLDIYYRRISLALNAYIPPCTEQLIIDDPNNITNILKDPECDPLDVLKMYRVSTINPVILLQMKNWLKDKKLI